MSVRRGTIALMPSEVVRSSDQSGLYWVIPGELAGMPMPYIHPDRRLNAGGPLADWDDDLPYLYSTGVRAVVSLLNLRSDQPIYESAGFKFKCLPIPDGGAPTLAQAREFVDFARENLTARRPVAVHCHAGIGRTGTLLCVYLIAQGETAEGAIHRVREVQRLAVETRRQAEFLREFERLNGRGR